MCLYVRDNHHLISRFCNDELDTILNSKSIVLTTPLICTSHVEQKSSLFD
jgi:hypothetical protein